MLPAATREAGNGFGRIGEIGIVEKNQVHGEKVR
jgi:hypothetical protein